MAVSVLSLRSLSCPHDEAGLARGGQPRGEFLPRRVARTPADLGSAGFTCRPSTTTATRRAPGQLERGGRRLRAAAGDPGVVHHQDRRRPRPACAPVPSRGSRRGCGSHLAGATAAPRAARRRPRPGRRADARPACPARSAPPRPRRAPRSSPPPAIPPAAMPGEERGRAARAAGPRPAPPPPRRQRSDLYRRRSVASGPPRTA